MTGAVAGGTDGDRPRGDRESESENAVGGARLVAHDGEPHDIVFPHRATAVVQPTGHASGRAIAELMLGVIADSADVAHRLASPVVEPGDTDGPVRG